MENETPTQSCECSNGKPMGIAAIVCVILGIAASWFTFLVGAALLVIAIVLGVVAITKNSKALGIVAICLAVVVGGPAGCALAGIGKLSRSPEAIEEFNKAMNKAIEEAAQNQGAANLEGQQAAIEAAQKAAAAMAANPEAIAEAQKAALEAAKAQNPDMAAQIEAAQKAAAAMAADPEAQKAAIEAAQQAAAAAAAQQ